jgi:glutamate dehydrogenase (NAD(P)+)
MEAFLREQLPERTWKNRLIREDGRCYMEFNATDIDRLARLGIEVDSLGPSLVVCMWEEKTSLEIGGYLVIDNLAMGQPSIGGIRMMPDVTPTTIHNLARGMTLKNAAANLPYGGGKVGIMANRHMTPEIHTLVIQGFARLLRRYTDIFLPGPDVGTNDADMKTIAIINGLDTAVSKPADLGGVHVDEIGAGAGGLIIALQALLKELPRLQVLPQFANIRTPSPDQLTVLIQGFGAVGANAACALQQRIRGARVIGVSDIQGYLYNVAGLPVNQLFRIREERGQVTRTYYLEHLLTPAGMLQGTKFSTAADDLLRESAFCLIPAAPIANYLDIDNSTHPSMTVDRMGKWAVIIEGANTYSPEPWRKSARARLEREIYRQRGILIATDYLVNSGAVIYAAQEHLIRTPDDLRIPAELFGNRTGVEAWIKDRGEALSELAEKRRQAAEQAREAVIQRNMRELIDQLIADADMLPCEAAETISIQRIASSERDRKTSEVMEPIPTISAGSSIRQAADLLVDTASPILAVLNEQNELVGVLTEWDFTHAMAMGSPDDQPLEDIMSKNVISAAPEDSILEVTRRLEHHEITAMPVVAEGCVQGMISTDILARRSLLKLLQTQQD